MLIIYKDQVSLRKISILFSNFRENKTFLFYPLVISYNQPKFCQNATWNTNSTTFADSTKVGFNPIDLFIDRNNNIYVPNRSNKQLIIWLNNTQTPSMNFSTGSTDAQTLFVTTIGQILIPSSGSIIQIFNNKSNINSTVLWCGTCFDSFVDINQMFYCSFDTSHQVVTKPLNSSSNSYFVIAGTGQNGSTSNMLKYPRGIFVDTNLDLYVADGDNDRIQLFHRGESNATTVAGTGSSTIALFWPSGVILDADKYLYIADADNHRIVGQGPNGFRCLVGGNGIGSASNQLRYPRSLSFDIYGNLFVVDTDNNRIQKFELLSELCSKCVLFYDLS